MSGSSLFNGNFVFLFSKTFINSYGVESQIKHQLFQAKFGRALGAPKKFRHKHKPCPRTPHLLRCFLGLLAPYRLFPAINN